ncbi:MAG: nitrous oxide reductase accessory protein NosL [Gemmatimonadaceae bacterium]
MTRGARALTLVAAVALGFLYVTPLWSVRLVAPQYPEGIGMLIRLNTVDGMKEHDLRNINSLNHYIGMKPIEPEAIPELKYMPWILAGLIGSGVVVAALGRRRLLVAWTGAFALIGAAGLLDFWRWSYDYGHNLDIENAIIVVPGMTYQPPLIGTKQLLNFTATSLPAAGGIIAGIAFALAVAAIAVSWKRGGRGVAFLGTAVLASACATGAPILHFGVDACVECRMLVSDARFGAVIVTAKGRTLPFDSIACLLKYTKSMPDAGTVWVVDAATPSRLVLLAQADVREDSALRPPMGTLVSYAR